MCFIIDPSVLPNRGCNLVRFVISDAMKVFGFRYNIEIIEERGLLGDLDTRRVFRVVGTLADMELLRATIESTRNNWICWKLAA